MVLNGALPRATPEHPAGVQGHGENCTSPLSLQQHALSLCLSSAQPLSLTHTRSNTAHEHLQLTTVITAAHTVSHRLQNTNSWP